MTNCDNIGIYDFTCLLQNQDFTIDFPFTEGEDNIPIDLRQYSNIKFGISDMYGKVFKTYDVLEGGLQIIGDDFNVLSVLLPQSLTLILKANIYTYDIMFVDSIGRNFYILKGTINIDRTITR
jgi:hypothetical protein